MKKLTLSLIILTSITTGWILSNIYRETGRITITAQTTDERGLTSVQFIQDGKEYALDYLTKDEYLKLINR